MKPPKFRTDPSSNCQVLNEKKKKEKRKRKINYLKLKDNRKEIKQGPEAVQPKESANPRQQDTKQARRKTHSDPGPHYKFNYDMQNPKP